MSTRSLTKYIIFVWFLFENFHLIAFDQIFGLGKGSEELVFGEKNLFVKIKSYQDVIDQYKAFLNIKVYFKQDLKTKD